MNDLSYPEAYVEMNDPSRSEDPILEDVEKEYMQLMGSGDRRAFDFALEESHQANYALQGLGMAIMKAAGADYENLPIQARAPALALLTVCARQSFLDVVEKEVAPLWAQAEYHKRVAQFKEMREEYERPEMV